MASIVKRGKSYSVVYYQGTGKKRQQVWESRLSYSTAKSRKAQIEHEQATNTISPVETKDMTVSEFLYEFIEKYGLKKWRASTYDGNNGLLENYVHPYLGDKKLRSIKTKTVLAVRWEYISKNPFFNATLPEHHEKERVILIAIGCTVRGGEIGGLQWDRVNFEKQIIHFDRAIDRIWEPRQRLF